MLLLQIGMNVAGGPYQAIVSDYLPPERVGRASSWMSVYQFSGSVVGILLTTQLHGVPLGVALAACLLGSWFATDRYVRTRARAAAIEAGPLRLDDNVRTVLASRAFINLGFYTLFGFLFFFVRESLGVPDARTTTGILILAFTVAGVIGAALAGRPSDRLDKRVVVTRGLRRDRDLGRSVRGRADRRRVAGVRDRVGRRLGRVLHRRLVDCVCGAAARRHGQSDGRLESRARDPASRGAGHHRTARRRARRTQRGLGPACRADLRHRRVRDRNGLAVAFTAALRRACAARW